MAVRDEYINLLVGIPGFKVTLAAIREFKDEDDSEDNGPLLVIALFRLQRRYRCRCGREFSSYYDRRERSVRDLSYGPYRRSYLCFSQMRVNCPECGVVTERLDWVDPRVNYTKRLAAAVALSCRETRSLSSIARQFGLHAHTSD